MSDHLQDARQPFVRIDLGVMDRVPEFGPLALAVYAVLAMYANNSSARCFPGRKAIARDAKISERAVDGALKALVSAGCIRVEPRTMTTPTGATVKTSNVYTLLTVPRKGGQSLQGGGAGDAPGVGQVVPQGGAGGAHRTSLNEPASIELTSKALKPLGAKAPGVRKPSPWSSLVDQILSDYGVAASKSNCSLAGKVVANAQANGLQPEDAAREWAAWMAGVLAEGRLRFVPLHKAANAWSSEWLLGERRRDSEAIVIEGGIL